MIPDYAGELNAITERGRQERIRGDVMMEAEFGVM